MAASAKRARVMGRSKKLGHCICDPRKPCPCELFIAKNVCLCAGERVENAAPSGKPPALTKLVKNAGCASKIPPAELAGILSRLPQIEDSRVLVGTATADDAGVFRISDDLCLVQTVDVFSPCVDDPYLFGRIAACNSLSDIYAMGGMPLTALSVIGFPIHSLSGEWMYRMLKGGQDVMTGAGVAIIGGHSINDEEIKFGYAVTGVIRPDRIVTNAGARPGDVLILTKKIGTGIISFAAQMGRASTEAIREIGESMATLNRAAAGVMLECGATACTDVTGFGLLGHLFQLARESKVSVDLWANAVPTFSGVEELARQGAVSGAAERNREYASHAVAVAEGVPEWAVGVLYDAQTSGGLLIAFPEDRAGEALAKLRAAGCGAATVVGRVAGTSEGRITVKNKEECSQTSGCSRAKEDAATAQPADSGKPCCSGGQQPERNNAIECCSASADGSAVGGAAAGNAEAAFRQFMGKAFSPGALDVLQKEITTIALSVAVQCEPCLTIHVEKARGMGVSDAEITEAAWMGVAFGGCKAMMFWGSMAGKLGIS